MRASGPKHFWANPDQMAKSEHMFKKMLRSDATIKQRFRCIYCRSVVTLDTTTAEHCLPRSRGGSTERKNIKGACADCNQAKGNGTEAWFRRILHGGGMPIWDMALTAAWIRFRFNAQVEKAEKRIKRFVGMQI